MVVLGHAYEGAGSPNADVFLPLILFGNSGVDLFFAISGFCLYYPYTGGRGPNWQTFYYRRVRRLMPPYYAAIAVIVVLPMVIQPVVAKLGLQADPVSWANGRQVLVHLLCLQTLWHDTYYNLDGPLWSLGIEWQFYFVFPVAVWLVAKLGWRALVLFSIVALGYRAGVASNFPSSAQWTFDIADLFPSRWVEFVLGMIVAIAIRRSRSSRGSRAHEVLDLTGIVSLYFAASFFLYGPLNQYPYPAKDLLNAFFWSPILLFACREDTLVSKVFSSKVLIWLGVRSYSLYLIHLPILFSIGDLIGHDHLGEPATLLAMFGLGVPLSLACTAVFFHVFERPFISASQSSVERSVRRFSIPFSDELHTQPRSVE